jgi:uncharacterized protein (DUF2249 family)/quercetin dioxygenase-like cupin family protein
MYTHGNQRNAAIKMLKLNINEFIQFNDEKFNAVVLVNEPDSRIVLLCLRAGQNVPEHSAAGVVTVQAVTGHVTFFDGAEPYEMFTGRLARLEPGRTHRVESHEDSALLVTIIKNPQSATSGGAPSGIEHELDLREVPRPERHPLVFARFDRLAVGDSFVIINDHDPRPLRTQIEQMREGEMSWEYIERGERIFRIRIYRIAPAGRQEAVSAGTPESPTTIHSNRNKGVTTDHD